MSENREYRSDVFSMLMENKKYALEVYNALEGTTHDDPEEVLIKTLEKGISLSVRNDAAFIIEPVINIYEHQSTYNPNMPLRSLIYLADTYKTELVNKDIYSSHKIQLQIPRCIVFYNGNSTRPELEIQRLSDLYKEGNVDASVELICYVYNINPGMNEDLKKKAPVLSQYTQFVELVKENVAKQDEEAIRHAIEYCIENNILRDFLLARKNEVMKNMTLDMTFERREKLFRKEERELGIQEGIEQGKRIVISEALKNGKTPEEIAVFFNIDLEYVMKFI